MEIQRASERQGKKKVGGLPLSDLKLPIIEIRWSGCKSRQKDQCKKIASMKEAKISGQEAFDKGDVTVQWGK